jgi:hemoglobin/transferrin/lactoferrin receptor protein
LGRIIQEPENYPLDHIPPVYGRLGIQAKKNKWNGEFYWLFNGRKDSSQYNLKGEDNQLYSADPARGFTPGWSTLNLRITLKINDLISAQVAVENILDKFYRTFASGMGAPGRNLVISLRAGW